MAFNMSRASVAELKKKYDRLAARAKNVAEKSEEAVGQVIRSVEVNGAAFGMGMVKGRFGSVEVLGVPADLGAGAVGHMLGFFGGGKYSEHIHNLSDGVLASYFTQLGAGIGARMAEESAQRAAGGGGGGGGGGSTSSGDPLASGDRLTDTELQALRSAGLR